MIIELYTDGSCLGNPGIGGYGVVMIAKDGSGNISKKLTIQAGTSNSTTNNRMELLAAIIALENLRIGSTVTLFSDSKYVVDGASKWMHNWKKKGFRGRMNNDLWRRLDKVIDNHTIDWQWLKGHNGHPEQEEADDLALSAASNGINLFEDIDKST